MKNYDESVEITHDQNSLYILDCPYRILITGFSRSSTANVLLNLIKHQRPDVDKIYLYLKDPLESKYQLLINGREKVGIKYEENPQIFIDYSQSIYYVYKNQEGYNPTKKTKVLIVFDDMIANMEANK